MRAKHPEMASDQAKMGLKWGVLASESTRIIENEPLRQQRSCARWVFPQPAKKEVRSSRSTRIRMAASFMGSSLAFGYTHVYPILRLRLSHKS